MQMAKSLEEKARDKKPLVRSSVATDENAPLKLLELLSNDADDMVRGDVATNESASEAILRKLSTDSDESVRCAVASNKSTPLDILATLLTDKSKYVKQNAKDNPNSKKIGKSQSADQKQTSLKPKKSESAKSKPINGEFSSQELTASVFTYTSAQFKKIKLKTELKKWSEDLESNSSSYPTYVGSPFHEKLNLETLTEDSEFSEDAIYVVPHYFYASAEYSFDGKIDSSYSILLAPILGTIMECKPMDCAQKDDEQIWFEGQGATDGSEYTISFFKGSHHLKTVQLNKIKDTDLSDVIKKI